MLKGPSPSPAILSWQVRRALTAMSAKNCIATCHGKHSNFKLTLFSLSSQVLDPRCRRQCYGPNRSYGWHAMSVQTVTCGTCWECTAASLNQTEGSTCAAALSEGTTSCEHNRMCSDLALPHIIGMWRGCHTVSVSCLLKFWFCSTSNTFPYANLKIITAEQSLLGT